MIGRESLFMGQNVVHLPVVDSTNAYCAMLAASGNTPEGTVVWADEQVQGRGQRGRIWQSNQGENLLVSYLLLPTFLKAHEQFDLSRAVALGVCWAVSEFVDAEVRIKWPNDILVNGQKVAGILIENGLRGSFLSYSVCGIGLNVNQTEFDGLPNATSLAVVSQRPLGRAHVLDRLSAWLEAAYLMLRSGNSAHLRAMFEDGLFMKGHWAQVRMGEQTTEIYIEGTLPDGRLLARYRNGGQLSLLHHEVHWIL